MKGHKCRDTPEGWQCEYGWMHKSYWTVDGPDQESGIYAPIFYCPWCGKQLED